MSPGCEWVLEGEGIARIKYDGTACLLKGGTLYKRYDARKRKEAPEGFIEAQERDENHWLGWVPIGDGPEDQYHRAAFQEFQNNPSSPIDREGRTFELIGPKIQGGAEEWATRHYLMPHHGQGFLSLEPGYPRTFDILRQFLEGFTMEGLVFHHPDGRMAKVKRKDLGLEWPIPIQSSANDQ